MTDSPAATQVAATSAGESGGVYYATIQYKLHPGTTNSPDWAEIALEVKIILTPPCIFHQ